MKNRKEYHVTCGYCEGFGTLEDVPGALKKFVTKTACPACNGSGKITLVYEDSDGKDGRIRPRVK